MTKNIASTNQILLFTGTRCCCVQCKHNTSNVKDKVFVLQNLSKHDIPNALTHKDPPRLDEVHGSYQMTPPEILHTSGSGLIMYMFKSLKSIYGSCKSGMD